jgi:hypothetical protein
MRLGPQRYSEEFLNKYARYADTFIDWSYTDQSKCQKR